MFDPSAPHIIILLVVVLLLFGSTRLPGAAKALGSSMRIFKREMKDMHDDVQPGAGTAATAQPGALSQPRPAPPQIQPQPPAGAPEEASQQQIEDLRRQIAELRNQAHSSTTCEAAEARREQVS